MKNKVRMLGLDPGIVNFGVGVTELNRRTGEVNILRTAMLKNPVNDFKGDFRTAVRLFRREIDGWITDYGVDGFIAERFQSRGLKGTSVELVSLMLGIMATRYHKLPHKFVIASTWKNDVNKRLADEGTDLKQLYKEVGIKAHQLDAGLMSVYGLRIATQVDVKYNWDRLLTQFEHTSRIEK